jgi:hypothetical protein
MGEQDRRKTVYSYKYKTAQNNIENQVENEYTRQTKEMHKRTSKTYTMIMKLHNITRLHNCKPVYRTKSSYTVHEDIMIITLRMLKKKVVVRVFWKG